MNARRFSIALLFLGIVVGFGSSRAHAADYKGIAYTIEPIVGYELLRKSNPTRSRLEFMYGARVTAGYKILAAEGEYTIGNSDELFPDTGARIEEKTEKARVGLRSTYAIGSMLDWFLRGGAEGQKIHTKTTQGGVVTETDSPAKVYPYVGTGVSVALASALSLNASILATLKDLNDFKQTEYTTTFGLKISLSGGR